MRVGTFNLENLETGPGARHGAPPLEERLPLLRPQIERMAADILCFQEVNAQRAGSGRHPPRALQALSALIDGTIYRDHALACSTAADGTGPLDVQNLVVLSRYPIREIRQHWHDLVAPPLVRPATAEPASDEAAPVRWDRPALHVVIDLPDGRTLHVFNVHLRAPLAAPVPGQKKQAFVWRTTEGWAEGYFLAAIKRTGQALETRLAIDAVFDDDPEALVLVCGDMNAESTETPLRVLCADVEDTGNGALAARMLIPLERTVPESRRYSVLHAGRPLLLDHMLVSRSLIGVYRSIEIHNEALSDEVIGYATVDRSPESYHAPLVAEFDLGQAVSESAEGQG